MSNSQEPASPDSRDSDLAALQAEVVSLKQLYDGVVAVNQQWAMDYERLQGQIQSTRLSGFTESSGEPTVLMSPSSDKCFDCYMRSSGLSGKITQLESQNEELVRERDQVIAENKAIHYQLTELGDLRQALHIKDEYPRLVNELKQLRRQLQNETTVRIKLERQIDSLRSAFSSIFPGEQRGEGQHHTYPPSAAGRPCHTQQQYYSDPGPPTPPGLIARGQLTSLVERDTRSLGGDEVVNVYEKPLLRQSRLLSNGHSASDPHLNKTNSLAPSTEGSVRSRSLRQRPHSLLEPLQAGNGLANRSGACPLCQQAGLSAGLELFEHLLHCND